MNYNKEELLGALKIIFEEYKNETHLLKKTRCTLCLLYLQNDYNCTDCPMNMFNGRRSNSYPCMNRKCEPVDCNDINGWGDAEYEKKSKRVIAYYEAIIKKIESMSEEELNAKKAFKFFKDIDKEIAKNYNIK